MLQRLTHQTSSQVWGMVALFIDATSPTIIAVRFSISTWMVSWIFSHSINLHQLTNLQTRLNTQTIPWMRPFTNLHVINLLVYWNLRSHFRCLFLCSSINSPNASQWKMVLPIVSKFDGDKAHESWLTFMLWHNNERRKKKERFLASFSHLINI